MTVMENKKSVGLKIKHANIILGLVFILLSAAIFFICRRDGLDFYHNSAPGPGFMPMIAASLIGICGAGIAVTGIFALKNAANNPELEKVIANWQEWRSFILITVICSLAIFLASYIGLITSVTLAVILLIRFLGPESWKTSIIVGLGTGIVIYLVFVVMLKVHVPEGPFGF
jgi:hypothetical protein